MALGAAAAGPADRASRSRPPAPRRIALPARHGASVRVARIGGPDSDGGPCPAAAAPAPAGAAATLGVVTDRKIGSAAPGRAGPAVGRRATDGRRS